MYDHVLIPTDGTETSARAVEHGVGLAAELGATVHALSVIEGAGAVQRDQIRADPEEESREAVEAVEAAADDAGVPVATALREGTSADEILEHIVEQQADLVVMGTDERAGLDRVFDNSVAEEVLENTTVPVLTVTNPA
ncbi:universal stress protein [Halovivax sp.]|uniref:universal stress protein n=1 Tax=Halovivax sp. TaxID=1935978 RepID=UPI0025BEEB6B|nr:universal stress protein [Halovivax sp.]